MKKRPFFSVGFLLLLLITPTQAAVDSIYEYLRKMDANYEVVLGAKGKSGDSLAAADIVVALKKHLNMDIEPVIENATHVYTNKILIGHPCENSLIQLSCEQWPYDEGVGMIKMMGNDLVITGTTMDDRRRAAKVIAYFKDYQQLKQTKELLVLGETLKREDFEFQPVKKESEFVCGDTLCEIGEKISCPADCAQISCYKLCQEKQFADAACRDPPSNVNLPFCLPDEVNQGAGYCGGEKVCCCQATPPQGQETKSQPSQQQPREEKLPIFIVIWRWLKELFAVLF